MDVKAATVTIEVSIDVESLTPSFGVGIQIHDTTFEFIAQDPELLPTWLHAVAGDVAKKLSAGGVEPRRSNDVEPAGEPDAIAEMQRIAAERNRTAEQEAIASILGTTDAPGGTA